MRNNQRGFTIMEIMIFITLISLIFIVFAQITTISLQTNKISENRIVANHLAEELQEWLRGQKELDFSDFVVTRTTGGGVWCFNSEPINNWGITGSCADYTLLSTFKRSVVLTAAQSNTQIIVTITVEWREGARAFQVPLKTIFALAE